MIYFMQGWKATTTHGVARKKGEKDEKHIYIGKLFRKNPKIKGVSWLTLDLKSFRS